MSSTTISTLNQSTKKIYWILIYSYNESFVKKPLSKEMIFMFPFNLYTPYKNRALPSLVLGQPLDLTKDEDLDIVLSKFNLTHVKSVSEMIVSENTNLIAIEVDHTKQIKAYIKHTTFYFYTAEHPPEYFIDNNDYSRSSVRAPNNRRLLAKLKVNIGRFIVTTNIIFKKIFTFLFKDYFEQLLSVEKKKDTSLQDLTPFQRFLKEKGYDISESEKSEDSETDSDRETTDSRLSYYSYCKRYNIKDVV